VAEAAMAAAPMTAARPARAAVLEPAVQATFDETLARYGAEIYRFALHLTRNRTDADDIYQETALKAYRAWDRLPCDANHRAWLYRIASNTFLSDKRKTSRLRSLDAEETVESIPATNLDDDGRLDAGNLLREVERFIEALPPKQRIALVQRKYLAACMKHCASCASGSATGSDGGSACEKDQFYGSSDRTGFRTED
jgi:RNA polymerase sigma-70 factor (ECF subfamily)